MDYAYNNFGKATLAWGFFNDKKNMERERTAYLDISKKYVLGDIASGDLKFGGKYRAKNRVKNSRQEFSPYYTQQYPNVRMSDGSLVPKADIYKGTLFENFQMDGSLVKFTNFIGAPPQSRSIFGKFRMNPLIQKDALVEWYNLNKNGFGSVEEYANNPIEYGNYYDVTEGVTAGYVMNTFNFGDLVTLIAGVRVEKEENEYRTRYSTNTVTGFPVPQGNFADTLTTYTETNVLPHLHLTFRPTDFMNIRLAAYKALARPDFNARLANLIADASSGMLLLSNPNLRSAKAWNYEVNSTIYGGVLGMISLSAFYKEIEDLSNTTNRMVANNNPMTNGQTFFDSLGIKYRNIFPANNTTLRVSVPYNSSIPAKVWGFEFDHQANLNFLPGYLQFFVLSYNLSFIRSEQHTLTWHTYTVNDTVIDPFFGPVVTTRNINYYKLEKNKLFNQPEFFGNVAVGYDIGDLSTRLSLFFQGSFPRSYSADGRNESITDAFNRWDLSVKYKVTDYASILFNVNNLNNFEESASSNHTVQPYWTLQTSRLRYGLTADLGVRVDL
ncbi:MAG: TonB-dependent receptor [Bacteroidetes bacterium]|nr:TonB-dependent receptor [Bacteroidota bacterium]